MSHLHLFANIPLSETLRKRTMKQTWNKEAIKEHLSEFTKEQLVQVILSLGSEGKNVLNILNQIKLAQELGGEFVGDKIDDYDIVVRDWLLELKCTTNQAMDLGSTVGFGSFLQKEKYDLLIHYLPKSFNKYLDEDKFVVFSKEDLPMMKEYSSKSGSLRWTAKLYSDNHNITEVGGKGDKLRFIKERITNLEGLKEILQQEKT